MLIRTNAVKVTIGGVKISHPRMNFVADLKPSKFEYLGSPSKPWTMTIKILSCRNRLTAIARGGPWIERARTGAWLVKGREGSTRRYRTKELAERGRGGV